MISPSRQLVLQLLLLLITGACTRGEPLYLVSIQGCKPEQESVLLASYDKLNRDLGRTVISTETGDHPVEIYCVEASALRSGEQGRCVRDLNKSTIMVLNSLPAGVFEAVGLHEVGHALGLAHISEPSFGRVMSPRTGHINFYAGAEYGYFLSQILSAPTTN